jgi:WD40 repeat protein
MNRVTWFISSLVLSCSANAAGLCSATILARISALQARAEETQSRALFSALQTRVRIAKSAGIDVSGIDTARAKGNLRKESQSEEQRAHEARGTRNLRAWLYQSWTKSDVSQSNYSPNGQLIAMMLFTSKSIEVRSAKDGSLVWTKPLTTKEFEQSYLHFITNELLALTNDDDENGKITLLPVSNPLASIEFETGTNRRFVIASGDRKRVLAMSEDRWDFLEFPSGKPVGRATVDSHGVIPQTDFTGNRLAYYDGRSVHVYDLAQDKTFSFVTNIDDSGFALSPDGKFVVMTGAGLSVWSIETGQKIRDFDTPGARTLSAHFIDQGRTLVAFDKAEQGQQTLIRFIDFETGELLDSASKEARAYQTGVSEDGSTIGFHGDDGRYHFYEVAPEAQP